MPDQRQPIAPQMTTRDRLLRWATIDNPDDAATLARLEADETAHEWAEATLETRAMWLAEEQLDADREEAEQCGAGGRHVYAEFDESPQGPRRSVHCKECSATPPERDRSDW